MSSPDYNALYATFDATPGANPEGWNTAQFAVKYATRPFARYKGDGLTPAVSGLLSEGGDPAYGPRTVALKEIIELWSLFAGYADALVPPEVTQDIAALQADTDSLKTKRVGWEILAVEPGTTAWSAAPDAMTDAVLVVRPNRVQMLRRIAEPAFPNAQINFQDSTGSWWELAFDALPLVADLDALKPKFVTIDDTTTGAATDLQNYITPNTYITIQNGSIFRGPEDLSKFGVYADVAIEETATGPEMRFTYVAPDARAGERWSRTGTATPFTWTRLPDLVSEADVMAEIDALDARILSLEGGPTLPVITVTNTDGANAQNLDNYTDGAAIVELVDTSVYNGPPISGNPSDFGVSALFTPSTVEGAIVYTLRYTAPSDRGQQTHEQWERTGAPGAFTWTQIADYVPEGEGGTAPEPFPKFVICGDSQIHGYGITGGINGVNTVPAQAARILDVPLEQANGDNPRRIADTGATMSAVGLTDPGQIAEAFVNRTAQATTSTNYPTSPVAKLQAAEIGFAFYGINDYARALAPIGSLSDTTDVSFLGAMHVAYQNILAANPNILFGFGVPFYRANTDWTERTVPNALGHTVQDYRDAIKGFCAKWNLPFIDSYGDLGINEISAPWLLQADYLHLSDAGALAAATLMARRMTTAWAERGLFSAAAA